MAVGREQITVLRGCHRNRVHQEEIKSNGYFGISYLGWQKVANYRDKNRAKKLVKKKERWQDLFGNYSKFYQKPILGFRKDNSSDKYFDDVNLKKIHER